jgi:hypothetical protein
MICFEMEENIYMPASGVGKKLFRRILQVGVVHKLNGCRIVELISPNNTTFVLYIFRLIPNNDNQSTYALAGSELLNPKEILMCRPRDPA